MSLADRFRACRTAIRRMMPLRSAPEGLEKGGDLLLQVRKIALHHVPHGLLINLEVVVH